MRYLPARRTKGLSSTANSDGSFPHPREAGCTYSISIFKLIYSSYCFILCGNFVELDLTYLYVLGSVISQPLVHLVADAQRVMFDAQISDHLELLSLVNLTRTWMCQSNKWDAGRSHKPLTLNSYLAYWVVGSVDNDGFCAWSEFTGQLLSRKNPVSTWQDGSARSFLKCNKRRCKFKQRWPRLSKDAL